MKTWIKKYLHKAIFVSIASLILINAQAQTYPPSCVVTMPHSNSYFKEGTDVVINVYSTDIGKSKDNGTVTKVEFYNGTTLLGEATSNANNTYTYTWGCVPAGNYTIKAKATNNKGVSFTSAGVLISVGTKDVTEHGIGACKGKYLANIIAGSVNADYNGLWNGVTAENGCKWGSVEGSQDVMSWGQADISYNHAKNNNLMFRYHAIAWGSQYPNWISNLTPTQFKEEIDEYMAAVAARYEYIDQIDVLNENNLYLGSYNNGQEHAAGTPLFRAGLGGAGTTGYDWVIWLFERARFHFPNSKLVMNDYELEGNNPGINAMLNVVKVLRDRGLIDGFGTQAHCFNVDPQSAATIKSAIDLMDDSGLPVYVTELDLNGGVDATTNDAVQKTSYETRFPVYWNHPSVAGITLWGYVDGSTWKTGTGLLTSSRAEKSAMKWLVSYMAARTDAGYPFCQTTGCTNNTTNPTIKIDAPLNGATFDPASNITISTTTSDPDGTVSKVEFYNGTTKLGQSTAAPFSFTWNNVTAGTYILTAVATDNNGNTTTSGQVTVTVKAPALQGTIVVRALGIVGDEIINLEVDGVVVKEWTLTTANADYTATGNVNGVIRVNYTNDDGNNRDVTLDRITVEGVVYEAEDQTINTAYYANGSCGGGSNSQLMHCSGYVEFATDPVNAADLCPNDPLKTEPGLCGCGIAEGTCSGPIVELRTGWNLVGCPIDGTTEITIALSSIWDNVQQVKDFNGFYDKTGSPTFNSLTELNWGRGYMVKVSAPCTLTWKTK